MIAFAQFTSFGGFCKAKIWGSTNKAKLVSNTKPCD